MSDEKIGPLRVRSPSPNGGRGDAGGPAVLLCHGFGAPGDDLVALGRMIDAGPGVRWFFPEAPIEVDFGMGATGRAWWEIDLAAVQEAYMRGNLDRLADEDPPGLVASRAMLEATIDELVRAHGVVRDRLVVGGFSQGAMLTTELALHAKEPFAGLVALSGSVIAKGRWAAAAKVAGKGIAALVTHGRSDPVLPFHGAEALVALLRESGADVTWVPFAGQHEIPRAAADALSAFAKRTLAPPNPG